MNRPHRPQRGRWKRWWRRSLLLAMGAITIVAVAGFLRLNLPRQLLPTLSRLQWSAPDAAVSEECEWIGHRGTGLPSTRHPEMLIGNTPNAIQAAMAAGVDRMEIDIRMSSDQRLVVFHDPSIDEKTTGVGMVSQLSLEELQRCEILVSPRERIPTLEEVLDPFPARSVRWVLDIKSPGIHQQLLACLDQRVAAGELHPSDILIAGAHDVLVDYQGCGYSLGLIAHWSNHQNRLRAVFRPKSLPEQCQRLGATHLILPVVFATKPTIEAAKAARLAVWVYGSDHPEDLRRLIGHYAVDGVIVDDPLAAKQACLAED